MRAVVTKVTSASVAIEGEETRAIAGGLLVLLGSQEGDTDADIAYIVDKVCNLRIFEDEQGKMNLSLRDVGGEILVVSQFTLLGDARKGAGRALFMRALLPRQRAFITALCRLSARRALELKPEHFRRICRWHPSTMGR